MGLDSPPSSPSRKRWILGAVHIDPPRAVANALSIPPGALKKELDRGGQDPRVGNNQKEVNHTERSK